MNDNRVLHKHDENVDPITTAQTSTPVGIGIDADLAGDKNSPSIMPQSDTRPIGKGMNSGLARALVGGLIGATLGTLAGALANKRTAKGASYAATGVSDGAKTVAEGVNHAATGVGNAVKSVAKGVNYSVVGGLVDVVKDAAVDAKQSVAAALDVAKDAAVDAKQSDNQSSKLGERLVVVDKQVTPGEIDLAQGETQTAYISAPVTKELVDESEVLHRETAAQSRRVDSLSGDSAEPAWTSSTISVDTETPVVSGDEHY